MSHDHPGDIGLGMVGRQTDDLEIGESGCGLLNPPVMRPTDGVLLIGHGTRDSQGTRQFFELGHQLTQLLSPVAVQPCLLELQSPTIQEGWAALVAAGCQRILAAPLLLFSAGHAKRDIPETLADCSAKTSHPFVISRPLSRAPEIVSLLSQRIRQAAEMGCGNPLASEPAIVLVGRGSYDPCAQADLKLLCGVLKHQLHAREVRPAFYAMAQPDLTRVVADIAAAGKFESIIVQPHLLFDGLIYHNLITQVEAARVRYPHLRFNLGPYLGPDPLVAAAVGRRLRQALGETTERFGVGSS